MLCDIMYMHINWGSNYKEVPQDAIRKVKALKGKVECACSISSPIRSVGVTR